MAPGFTGAASTSPFGSFGAQKKPDTPTATPAPATSTTAPAPLFSGGTFGSFTKPASADATKDKDKEKEAEKGKEAPPTANAQPAGTNIFSSFSAKKPEEPAKPAGESGLLYYVAYVRR